MPEHQLRRLNGTIDKVHERVLREFDAGRGATSSRIAATYDVFLTQLIMGTEGPAPVPTYGLVLEWLEGSTLSAVSGLNQRERLRAAMELSEAVAEVHRRGLIHRDVKPDNAMLVANRGVVLTDFGISKGLDDSTVTSEGDALFTERYASPEQIGGAAGESADDIYALGISILEIVSGEPAYKQRSRVEILLDKAKALPPSTQALEAVPPLKQLVGAMTESQHRRPDIDTVVGRLREILELGP